MVITAKRQFFFLSYDMSMLRLWITVLFSTPFHLFFNPFSCSGFCYPHTFHIFKVENFIIGLERRFTNHTVIHEQCGVLRCRCQPVFENIRRNLIFLKKLSRFGFFITVIKIDFKIFVLFLYSYKLVTDNVML